MTTSPNTTAQLPNRDETAGFEILGDQPDVFLIENEDRGAGFWAQVTFALNGALFAESKDLLPVVCFNEEWNPFHDASTGPNVWDYYFEPPAGVTSDALTQMIDSGDYDPRRVRRLRDFVSRRSRLVAPWVQLHYGLGPFRDFDRVATFPFGRAPMSRDALAVWMRDRRARGREVAGRFLSVKPHVLAKADAFYERCMAGRRVIGAHVRGSDFSYAFPTPPERYFEFLDEELSRDADTHVFLATDQRQFVESFQQRYGDRVLVYDCLRSDGDTAPFEMTERTPYTRGEEPLLDTLLLSRCNYLLKCAAAGGEFAMYLEPDLQCTDFALDSMVVWGGRRAAFLDQGERASATDAVRMACSRAYYRARGHCVSAGLRLLGL